MPASQDTYWNVVMNGLPDAVLLANDDRRYVGANDAACSLLGLTREEVLARGLDDVAIRPATHGPSAWRDFLERGTLEGRFALRNPREGVVDVDFHARANVMDGLHVTVLRRSPAPPNPDSSQSARRVVDHFGELLKIQDALFAPNASVDSVMEAICERATTFSGADGTTIEIAEGDELVYRVVSGSMAPFAGFRLKQAGSLSGLGLTTGKILVCEDSETDDRVDREACRRVGARSMIVVPLVHGEAVHGVLKVSSSRPSAFGRVVVELLRLLAGFFGTAMAQAEAQEVRMALERQERERIAELERLREELASLVVHDLRAPLAAVVINLEFLRDQLPKGSADAIEAAVDALASTRRLDGLIRTLLETAKLEQRRMVLHTSTVRLAELLDPLRAERAKHARDRRIALIDEVDPEQTVVADPSLLRRVLDNVVDNAFRYTPEDGRIVFAAVDRGNHVELRIGNSGPAIPLEAHERIFEKFGQAERAGRSNFGLGLYFCRLVLEAHGGRISVDSEPQLPTVFALAIPKTRAQSG